MVQFNSHYAQQSIPMLLPDGTFFKVVFANHIYTTDDPVIIAKMRDIVQYEKRGGGNQAVTESLGNYNSTLLKGVIHINLEGYTEQDIYLHNESLDNAFNRILSLLGSQDAQHESPVQENDAQEVSFVQEDEAEIITTQKAKGGRPRKTA